MPLIERGRVADPHRKPGQRMEASGEQAGPEGLRVFWVERESEKLERRNDRSELWRLLDARSFGKDGAKAQ